MRPSLPIGALTLMLAVSGAAQQQDNSAPPAQQSQPATVKSGSAKQKPHETAASDQPSEPPATDQNPFPDAQSERAAHQAANQQSQSGSTPDQPRAHTGSSTADQNPFPEAESEKAAQQAGQQSAPPDKAAAPGDKDYSSSQSGLKGLDLPAASGGTTSRGAGGTVLSPELGREDTKVGNFYLQTGDYKGAYDRFAEATRVAPGNAEAVFGLAEAARRLNRRSEAVSNYQLYLSALPDGPKSKVARKALKELGAPPHS